MRAGVLAVALKEFRHMLHDRVTLALTLALPVLQLLMYGYALETRVLHLPAALVNLDMHAPAQLLAARISQSALFKMDASYSTEQQMRAAVQRGAIRAAIEIPPDYSENLLLRRKAVLRVWVDGADAATSNYLLTAVDSFGIDPSGLNPSNIDPGIAAGPRATVDAHIVSNPSGRTSAFLIPGLIAILLQTIVALLMALALATERESGTLEQLLTTRLGPDAIILGKTLAIGAIGFAESWALVAVMRYFFAIPVMGSLWLLAAVIPLLVFTPLGLGLLIAARARNHSQALQYANVVLLPSILLSGFVFPQELLNFPFNALSRMLPCSYLVSLTRDIILRGTPASAIPDVIVPSIAFACLILASGYWSLRRSLGQ